MQRKDITGTEHAYVLSELADAEPLAGSEVVQVTTGTHEQHGLVVLIKAGGHYVAICEDTSFVTGLDEEPDL